MSGSLGLGPGVWRWAGQKEDTTKGQVGPLRGDGYVYYLDCGDGFTGVYVCWTFSNGIHESYTPITSWKTVKQQQVHMVQAIDKF